MEATGERVGSGCSAGLLVEVRLVAVVRRVDEPETIPALLARPEVFNSTSLGADDRLAIGRHLMHGGRSTRGTLCSRADGETPGRAHSRFGCSSPGHRNPSPIVDGSPPGEDSMVTNLLDTGNWTLVQPSAS